MSFFENLFGKRKKRSVRHKAKLHKKNAMLHSKKNKVKSKHKSNKKIISPADRKKHDKVKKLVFNSDIEVEKYYQQEKERAKDFLKGIEKQKAVTLLEVAKKQYDQIKA